MFSSAHIVVKAVMLGLFLASLWCWTIIFDKTRLFRKFESEMESFEQMFWSGQSLEELYTSLSKQTNNTAAAALFVAAMREWKRSFQQAAGSFRGLHARIDKVLDVSIAREVERLESNLLVLATVASAGPFIGLFGTVFGIMNSFQSIAASKNTWLAVVAPGIAEAMLATAIGLFAAIPALIAYNKLQGDVAKAQARLESFADEFRRSCPGRLTIICRSKRSPEAEGAARWPSIRSVARKSGRGRRGVPRYGAMADINMTPFIDVMLVLLIIFMVAAPLLTTGVSVDLPRASATALNVDRKPIAVSLNEQGQLYVMDQPIGRRGSGREDPGRLAKRHRQRIYLRASKDGALRARGGDHGGGHFGRVQEGGAGHRADQTIAGSGVGRTAVICEFRGLRGAARGGAGDDPARRRLGSEDSRTRPRRFRLKPFR